jgi:YggT family protein
MSPLSCSVVHILGWVLRGFSLLMLLYAVVSWVPSLQGRWSYYVARVVEPVLMPLRRVIPPVGGLDLSFLIVIILVNYLSNAMLNLPACYIY